MILQLLLIMTFICWCQGSVQVNPIISTPSGKIEGTYSLTSRLGKQIFAFRGIRYAKPPVGELRFQPPVPIDRWDGVYNATANGPMCPQLPIATIGEDCLVVNVYSTKLPSRKGNPKRPVIVYIHPGGFYGGGSASYWGGPQYYMDQDIVLVTFNYRLASLGFISTGDSFAPGNNGLKDQVVLLKWVKKHIESFGGDPDNITLVGYSAGAWSIILHMVSPMSQYLFHKGIVMSGGGPLGNFPLPQNQLELAKKQARIVGCPDDTSENIIKCLKNVSAEILGASYPDFALFGYDPILIWSPVIDGEFLTDDPIRLIIQGRFKKNPLMVGQTKDETGERVFMVLENQTLTDKMNTHFEEIAPISFIYESGNEQSKKVSKAVKSFYFNDKHIDKSQFANLNKVYSDSIIGFGVHRAAKLMARYSTKPVFRYCFTFQGRWSHFYRGGTNNTWGVVHHDDLIYLLYFETSFPLIGKDSPKPEVDMVEKLTSLHANFARTGNPIPKPCNKLDNINWVPFDLKSEIYMDIGEKLTLKDKLYEKRFAFWDRLYPLSMYQ